MPTDLHAFLYQGSKYSFADWIVQHLPLHRCYVEPFCGSASVLFAKPRSTIEILNDTDRFVLCTFRAIRRHPAQMRRILQGWMKSRELFSRFRDDLKDIAANGGAPVEDIEVACKWFYLHWMSFGGKGTIYGTSVERSQSPPYWKAIDRLPAIAHRLQYVELECGDFAEVIRRYDSPETVFLCDPPYVKTNIDGYRGGGAFGEPEHDRLAEVMRSVRGKVVLCGFAGDGTDARYPGWCTVTLRRPLNVLRIDDGAPRPFVTECLWMNGDWSSQPSFFDMDVMAGDTHEGDTHEGDTHEGDHDYQPVDAPVAPSMP